MENLTHYYFIFLILQNMFMEIERRFLVDKDIFNTIKQTLQYEDIRQWKFLRNWDWSLRTRIKNKKWYITLKKNISSMSREEYESEISPELAWKLLDVFGEYEIYKRRYYYIQGFLTWEIDEYFGDNEWLIVAEVELTSENQEITMLEFIYMEITNDKKYRNSELAKNPYKKWKV